MPTSRPNDRPGRARLTARSGGALGLLVAALAVATGCKFDRLPRNTEIAVKVISNIPIPDWLDGVRVRAVRADGRTMAEQSVALGAGQGSLPMVVVVAPLETRTEVFRVFVDGTKGGAIVVTRTARTWFVPEQSRLLGISLLLDCLGKVAMCGDEETCVEGGVCAGDTQPPEELPRYIPDAIVGPQVDSGAVQRGDALPGVLDSGFFADLPADRPLTTPDLAAPVDLRRTDTTLDQVIDRSGGDPQGALDSGRDSGRDGNPEVPIVGPPETGPDTGRDNATEAISDAAVGEPLIVPIDGDSDTKEAAAPVCVPPSPPANLVTSPTDRAVWLGWNASASAGITTGGSPVLSYTVHRSVTSGAGYAPVTAGTGLTTTYFVDSDLVNGVPYYYVVTASNGECSSTISNEAVATPFAPPPGPGPEPGAEPGSEPGPEPGPDAGGADACVPSCTAKLCGNDGCAGDCGACGSGEVCEPSLGICRILVPSLIEPASSIQQASTGDYRIAASPDSVYSIVGWRDWSFIGEVYRFPRNADGTLGDAVYYGQPSSHLAWPHLLDNRLYIFGDNDGSCCNRDRSDMAPILAGGGLGAFTQIGDLPYSANGWGTGEVHFSAMRAGRVYISNTAEEDCCGMGNAPSVAALSAPVNTDGTVGAWRFEMESQVANRFLHGNVNSLFMIRGDYAYVLTFDPGTRTFSMYRAPFGADGVILVQHETVDIDELNFLEQTHPSPWPLVFTPWNGDVIVSPAPLADGDSWSRLYWLKFGTDGLRAHIVAITETGSEGTAFAAEGQHAYLTTQGRILKANLPWGPTSDGGAPDAGVDGVVDGGTDSPAETGTPDAGQITYYYEPFDTLNLIQSPTAFAQVGQWRERFWSDSGYVPTASFTIGGGILDFTATMLQAGANEYKVYEALVADTSFDTQVQRYLKMRYRLTGTSTSIQGATIGLVSTNDWWDVDFLPGVGPTIPNGGDTGWQEVVYDLGTHAMGSDHKYDRIFLIIDDEADTNATYHLYVDYISITAEPPSAWIPVESINVSQTTGEAAWPVLAVDSHGYPHIAWPDNSSGNWEIYYLKWNGSAWVDADGAGRESLNVSQTSGASGRGLSWNDRPWLVLDNQDRPHLAWSDDTSGASQIYYLWWNGSAWVDADGMGRESIAISPTSGTSVQVPILAVDSANRPHITFSCGGACYREWDGTAWQTLGGAEQVAGFGGGGVMALDSSGRPGIFGSTSGTPGLPSQGPLLYLQWNGSAWTDADGVGQESKNLPTPCPTIGTTEIVMDSADRPHVSWHDGFCGPDHINYLWWGGTAWVDADGSGTESTAVAEGNMVSLALDDLGRPGIAGDGPNNAASYQKWNGAAWVDVDGASQGFTNIGPNAADYVPFLRFAPGDCPQVAWGDSASGRQQIYYVTHCPLALP
jgi:hypothetical protein